MNHQDHVRLLTGGVSPPGGTWADLGAGRGPFTLALAELLGARSTIYAVDKDNSALAELSRAFKARAPEVRLHTLTVDFVRPLALPPLDGLVMANSLHYVEDKRQVVVQIAGYLKAQGRLILVEYDTDVGNRWVPYPLSFTSWQRLAKAAGLEQTVLLGTASSSFLGGFYSAMSTVPGKP